jgi:hypothetical protein
MTAALAGSGAGEQVSGMLAFDSGAMPGLARIIGSLRLAAQTATGLSSDQGHAFA